MSAGERAILRISKDISNLEDALILIDEVEAGLHPYTQQQAMLEFQRIALRNRLQIIVASHSPVILESVPPEARLFLDRDEVTSEVYRVPLYRDVLQKALYGQSKDRLSILCEDDVAEGLIRGFLDALNVDLQFLPEDFVIGRDTGRDQFPAHVETLGKFHKLNDFLFVLDGDSRHKQADIETAAAKYGQVVQPLFLPGDGPPETWIWNVLESRREQYSETLGMTNTDMEQRMRLIKQMAEGAVKQSESGKIALEAFAQEVDRTVPDIARIVGQHEARRQHGDAAAFLIHISDQITAWRQS
jgi:hypothetical protein